MTYLTSCWRGLVLILCASGLSAEVLDDSLSPRQQYRFQFEWVDEADSLAGGPSADTEIDDGMVGYLSDVDVRLDTSAYVGQRARIYLSLPRITQGAPADSPLRLSWTTNGLFNSGEVTTGQRALLFEGRVTESVTRELFDFVIHFDSRVMDRTLKLDSVYEIEIM